MDAVLCLLSSAAKEFSHQCLIGKERRQIPDDKVAHRGPCLTRRTPNVRQKHNVVQSDQCLWYTGFLVVDIETGGRDSPVLQCVY